MSVCQALSLASILYATSMMPAFGEDLAGGVWGIEKGLMASNQRYDPLRSRAL